MPRSTFLALIILSISLFLSGCASNEFLPYARTMEKDHGFTKRIVEGGLFHLTTYQKIQNPHKEFVFYIEGDGKAFVGRGHFISSDPTPSFKTVIRLADMDPRENVVYIARPCQFTPLSTEPNCNNLCWTDQRWSQDAVTSINEVITKIAGNNPANLIGFSGGGGIAVLVAAQNKNVKSIITVAGNIDIAAFNEYHENRIGGDHHLRPLTGSLNPIDFARKVRNIPQLHLSGSNDKIVPSFISEGFAKAANNHACVKIEIIPDASHNKGWDQYWTRVLNKPLACDK